MENRITSTSLTVSELTAENITSIFLYGTLNVPEIYIIELKQGIILKIRKLLLLMFGSWGRAFL